MCLKGEKLKDSTYTLKIDHISWREEFTISIRECGVLNGWPQANQNQIGNYHSLARKSLSAEAEW